MSDDLKILERLAEALPALFSSPNEDRSGWYCNPFGMGLNWHRLLLTSGPKKDGFKCLTLESQGAVVMALLQECQRRQWEPNCISNWSAERDALRWAVTLYPRTATANAHAWGDHLWQAMAQAVLDALPKPPPSAGKEVNG